MLCVYRLMQITLLLTALFVSACSDDFDGSMAGCEGADARNVYSDGDEGGCSGPGYDIMLDVDVDEDKGTAEVEVLFIGDSYNEDENVETRHGGSANGTRMIRGGDTPFAREIDITLTWVCAADISARSASDKKEVQFSKAANSNKASTTTDRTAS